MAAANAPSSDPARLLLLLAERVVARGADHVRAALACPAAAEILDVAAALRYKRAVPERPRMVGLLGCASVGKSLIFNSLAGAEISRVRYEPHTSQGAVAFLHGEDWRKILDVAATQPAPFGLFAAAEVRDPAAAQRLPGDRDHLVVVLHDEEDRRGVVLVDLPDISSAAAARDPVARRFLPWLDGVLLTASCDTINARAYDDQVERLAQLGLWRWGVLNNLEGLDLAEEMPEPARARFESLGASACYVLPFLAQKRDFTRMAADARGFASLRAALRGEGVTELARSNEEHIERFLCTLLAQAPAAMRDREQALAELDGQVNGLIRQMAERPPEIVALEDLVGRERRGDMAKVGYNPYRILTLVKDLAAGAMGWFAPGAAGAGDEGLFQTRRAAERYRRHLAAFEGRVRTLYGQHALVRPLRRAERPLLPPLQAETIRFESELTEIIGAMREEVTQFLEHAVAEFHSPTGRTKRAVYYGTLSLGTGLAVLDLFFLPGSGVAIASGLAAAAQVLYPELRRHLHAFRPITDKYGRMLSALCERHLERIAAAYRRAVAEALPTDPELREAIEEILR